MQVSLLALIRKPERGASDQSSIASRSPSRRAAFGVVHPKHSADQALDAVYNCWAPWGRGVGAFIALFAVWR